MNGFRNNFLKFRLQSKTVNFLDLSEKLLSLHSSCFNDSQQNYSIDSMLYFLENNKNHLFYDEISLAIIQVSDLEADLITIAVKPGMQGKGIGLKLVELLLSYLKNLGIKKLFLEVASSNIKATKLYTKVGFKTCGLRKNYYRVNDPLSSEALLMVYYLCRKTSILDKKKLQKLYPTG